MITNTLLDAALDAADRGWPVFPLLPGSKRPALHGEASCPGAGPCTAGHQGWGQRATTDPDRIRACWGTATPYNIGIATGPAGLVVIDVDHPKPGAAPPEGWDLPGIVDGHDVLAALCEQVGQPLLLDTYTVATPSGGTHLYYQRPADGPGLRNSTGMLGWLVDTRAAGGYVVAAGSHTPAGAYEVAHDGPPALLPGWLAARLSHTPAPAAGTVHRLGDRESRRLGPLLRTVLEAREGQRNSRLYWAAIRLFAHAAAGQVDPRAGADALLDAATHVGLPAGEARATIASAYRHQPTGAAA